MLFLGFVLGGEGVFPYGEHSRETDITKPPKMVVLLVACY